MDGGMDWTSLLILGAEGQAFRSFFLLLSSVTFTCVKSLSHKLKQDGLAISVIWNLSHILKSGALGGKKLLNSLTRTLL